VPSTPPFSSAANVVLRLGSVHVGAMPTLHAVSGASAMLMSSACPPSPRSAERVPVLGALLPSVDEPFTVVPAMLPDASSCSTSLGVITHGEPSTRVQSADGFSFPPPEHVP
jgi:hypothetical protein